MPEHTRGYACAMPGIRPLIRHTSVSIRTPHASLAAAHSLTSLLAGSRALGGSWVNRNETVVLLSM